MRQVGDPKKSHGTGDGPAATPGHRPGHDCGSQRRPFSSGGRFTGAVDTYPDLPVWPLFSPLTLSVVATVTALHLLRVARRTRKDPWVRGCLAVLPVVALAPLLLPFGLGASTGCTDTGGSIAYGPAWYLGLVAMVPVTLLLHQLYVVAGAQGMRAWNPALGLVLLAAAMFVLETLLSVFGLFSACGTGHTGLLSLQLGLTAAVPLTAVGLKWLRRTT